MPRPANQQSVLNILENLNGLAPLKELFWTELQYDRINGGSLRWNRAQLNLPRFARITTGFLTERNWPSQCPERSGRCTVMNFAAPERLLLRVFKTERNDLA
jgi:hypothetical protein